MATVLLLLLLEMEWRGRRWSTVREKRGEGRAEGSMDDRDGGRRGEGGSEGEGEATLLEEPSNAGRWYVLCVHEETQQQQNDPHAALRRSHAGAPAAFSARISAILLRPSDTAAVCPFLHALYSCGFGKSSFMPLQASPSVYVVRQD